MRATWMHVTCLFRLPRSKPVAESSNNYVYVDMRARCAGLVFVALFLTQRPVVLELLC